MGSDTCNFALLLDSPTAAGNIALLRFPSKPMRRVIKDELSIPGVGAWEKRAEKREEILQMRKEIESVAHEMQREMELAHAMQGDGRRTGEN